jgi:hypothetical protein
VVGRAKPAPGFAIQKLTRFEPLCISHHVTYPHKVINCGTSYVFESQLLAGNGMSHQQGLNDHNDSCRVKYDKPMERLTKMVLLNQ